MTIERSTRLPADLCCECEGSGIFTLVSHRGLGPQGREGLYRELLDCPGCQGTGLAYFEPDIQPASAGGAC